MVKLVQIVSNDPRHRSTTYLADDGRLYTLHGDLSDRANNPGNISPQSERARSRYESDYGAIGYLPSSNGPAVAVFPTLSQGNAAQADLWQSSAYRDKTLTQAANAWATDSYAPVLVAAAGVPGSTKVKDLTPAQMQAVLAAQNGAEGSGNLEVTDASTGASIPVSMFRAPETGQPTQIATEPVAPDTSLIGYAAPPTVPPALSAIEAATRDPDQAVAGFMAGQPVANAGLSPVLDFPTGAGNRPIDVSGLTNPGPLNQGVKAVGLANDLFGGLATPNPATSLPTLDLPPPPFPAERQVPTLPPSSPTSNGLFGTFGNLVSGAKDALGGAIQTAEAQAPQIASSITSAALSSLTPAQLAGIYLSATAKPVSERMEAITGTPYASPINEAAHRQLMAQQGRPVEVNNPPPLPIPRPSSSGGSEPAPVPMPPIDRTPAFNSVNARPGADLASLGVPAAVNVPEFITVSRQVPVPSSLPIEQGEGVHFDPSTGQYVLGAAEPPKPQFRTVTERVPNPAYRPPLPTPPVPAMMSPALRESRLPLPQRLFDMTPIGHIVQAARGIQPNGGLLGLLMGKNPGGGLGGLFGLAGTPSQRQQHAAATTFIGANNALMPGVSLSGQPVNRYTPSGFGEEEDGSPFWG